MRRHEGRSRPLVQIAWRVRCRRERTRWRAWYLPQRPALPCIISMYAHTLSSVEASLQHSRQFRQLTEYLENSVLPMPRMPLLL